MQDYQKRLVKEYRETKERYRKLHRFLVQLDAGIIDDDKLTCPDWMLRRQAAAMGEYLYCLELRAAFEGIPFDEEHDMLTCEEALCGAVTCE